MSTTIRPNAALVEAQIEKESIFTWAGHSAGAQDYTALTAEILTRL